MRTTRSGQASLAAHARSRPGAGRRRRAFAALTATAGLAWAFGGGCSLGNLAHDDCTGDAECTALFGIGSRCVEGFCSEPEPCEESLACRDAYGYGATCQDGICKPTAPDPRCTLSEPEDLAAQLAAPVSGRIVLGAMFKLGTAKERARDADGDAANDADETKELTRYLAGDLQVPLILGPSSSASATAATSVLLEERLPTVILTPSATSSTLTNLVDRFDPASDPLGLLWRTCPSDALQGEVLASTIAATLTNLKVVVLYPQDTYGQGLEETFRDDFTALAGHTVASFPFAVDESDLAFAVGGAAAEVAPNALLVISGDAARTVKILELASQAPTLATLPLFLTDGSKDAAVLLDPGNAPGVQAFVATARGTAPASPSGTAYGTFAQNLQAEFGTDAAGFSFVAQSYDAAYCGVFGVVHALSLGGTPDPATGAGGRLEGFAVAEGLASLAAGVPVNVGPTGFTTGVSELVKPDGTIDVEGTSGHLDFDAETGEAPGPIEIWGVDATGTGFETLSVTP